MNVRLKRARELAGYAVQLTKDEGLGTMLARGAGFVRRRCFGKKARYLPAKKVLEAQRAEMAEKNFENCQLSTISVLTPLYNTPEVFLRQFLDSFVNQTAPNGELCLADASDAAHSSVGDIVRDALSQFAVARPFAGSHAQIPHDKGLPFTSQYRSDIGKGA